MNPEPDTPPTSSPDSYPLGDLVHAALQSKEYLGKASAGTLKQIHQFSHAIDCLLQIPHIEYNLWTV